MAAPAAAEPKKAIVEILEKYRNAKKFAAGLADRLGVKLPSIIMPDPDDPLKIVVPEGMQLRWLIKFLHEADQADATFLDALQRFVEAYTHERSATKEESTGNANKLGERAWIIAMGVTAVIMKGMKEVQQKVKSSKSKVISTKGMKGNIAPTAMGVGEMPGGEAVHEFMERADAELTSFDKQLLLRYAEWFYETLLPDRYKQVESERTVSP